MPRIKHRFIPSKYHERIIYVLYKYYSLHTVYFVFFLESRSMLVNPANALMLHQLAMEFKIAVTDLTKYKFYVNRLREFIEMIKNINIRSITNLLINKINKQ